MKKLLAYLLSNTHTVTFIQAHTHYTHTCTHTHTHTYAHIHTHTHTHIVNVLQSRIFNREDEGGSCHFLLCKHRNFTYLRPATYQVGLNVMRIKKKRTSSL
jgi:hypothetical protein